MKNLAIGSMSHLIDGLRILQAYSDDVRATDGEVYVYCKTKVFEHDDKKLHLMGWKNFKYQTENKDFSSWEYCL